MPSKSPKQARFMAAVAHNKDFAKKAGVPQSVGKEFNEADRKKKVAQDAFRGALDKRRAARIAQDDVAEPSLHAGAKTTKYHKNMTAEHMAQAADHFEAAEQHSSKGNLKNERVHHEAARAHLNAANHHFDASRATLKARAGGLTRTAQQASEKASNASTKAKVAYINMRRGSF